MTADTSAAGAGRPDPLDGRGILLRAAFGIAALLAAAPLNIFAASPVPAAAKASLAGLAILTFWRPVHGVLVLAALGPISVAIQSLVRLPFGASALVEAAVLSVLTAAALRACLRGRTGPATAFDWAAFALACIAAASVLALLPIARLRAGEADRIGDVLLRHYFQYSAAYPAVWLAAVIVEGAALAALAARAARDPGDLRRVVDATVFGAAAAAALNVNRLLELALRNPPFLDTLGLGLRTLRFNTQHGDLNAAGSYFALAAVLCFGCAGLATARQRVHTALLPLLACGLWISGSRVALGTTLLSMAALILVRRAGSRLRIIRWRTVAGGAAAAAVVFVAFLLLFPSGRHGTFGYSAYTRIELARVAVRMFADRPVFGVGVSQFYARFPEYAPAELLEAFRDATGTTILHENAHNQFLQEAAELGALGLAAFLAVLALALRSDPSPGTNPDRLAARAALGAFLLTCLAGHPLLIPLVAYPFWILAGAAAGGGRPVSSRAVNATGRAALLLAVVLAASMPLRWGTERRTADLSGVAEGMSSWQRDESGARYRWAGPRSSLFVAGNAALVRLPLRATGAAPLRVNLELEGRPAAGVIVEPGDWTEATLVLPRRDERSAYLRVDVIVQPQPGSPGGADPARLLMVGRPVEVLAPR